MKQRTFCIAVKLSGGCVDVEYVETSSDMFKLLTATFSCILLVACFVSVVVWRYRLHIKLYIKEMRRTPPNDDGLSSSHAVFIITFYLFIYFSYLFITVCASSNNVLEDYGSLQSINQSINLFVQRTGQKGPWGHRQSPKVHKNILNTATYSSQVSI